MKVSGSMYAVGYRRMAISVCFHPKGIVLDEAFISYFRIITLLLLLELTEHQVRSFASTRIYPATLSSIQ